METNKNDELDVALRRLYGTSAPAEFEIAWRAAIRREESLQMRKEPTNRHIWRRLVPVFAALVLIAGSLWAGTQTFDTAERAAVERPMTRAASMNEGTGSAMLGAESGSYGAANSPVNYSMADSGTSLTGDAANQGQKLVRTADVTIRSTAFEQDSQKVQTLLSTLGGYVENFYQYGDTTDGSSRSVTLSMRVPSDKLSEFLTGVEGIGRVINRSESTTDMTVQYTDNEVRLNTLRAKMTRLNELLAKAENVSDLVEIESAIADTQYQIDSFETSQRDIDRRVDMSAVSVTVQEETPSQSAAAADKSLGERISAALNASVIWLGDFFRNMVVFVVMILPVLVPVAIVCIVCWLVVRRRKKNQPKNDSPKEE
ncbi:MAG: DUF4349 domain-containing protein [Clostridia bacterium]